jgi:hypothetical protein
MAEAVVALAGVIFGTIVGGAITWLSGSRIAERTFERQQQAERERWAREQRIAAFSVYVRTVRSAHNIESHATYLRNVNGFTDSLSIARTEQLGNLGAALAGVRLVAGPEVVSALDGLDDLMTELHGEQTRAFAADHERCAELLARIERGMRNDLDGPSAIG